MCFELSKIWQNIEINDRWPRTVKSTDVKEDTDEHSTHSLDYDQATRCLQQIGHCMQNVSIRPSRQFAKLYQFFVLLEWYFMNQVNAISIPQDNNIRRLCFKFPCNRPIDEDVNGVKLFGVGGGCKAYCSYLFRCIEFFSILIAGQLIGSFKKLLLTMKKLCDLELVDLVLIKYEANSLMDSIGLHLNRTIKQFSCTNLTLNHCPIHQIGMLYNLQVISVLFQLHSNLNSLVTLGRFLVDIENIAPKY